MADNNPPPETPPEDDDFEQKWKLLFPELQQEFQVEENFSPLSMTPEVTLRPNPAGPRDWVAGEDVDIDDGEDEHFTPPDPKLGRPKYQTVLSVLALIAGLILVGLSFWLELSGLFILIGLLFAVGGAAWLIARLPQQRNADEDEDGGAQV